MWFQSAFKMLFGRQWLAAAVILGKPSLSWPVAAWHRYGKCGSYSGGGKVLKLRKADGGRKEGRKERRREGERERERERGKEGS